MRIANGRTFIGTALVALTFALCCAPPRIGLAAGSDPGAPVKVAETELIDAFGDLCLNRFPDEAAFAQGVGLRGLVAMPVAGVKEFLHDDPGRGWYGKTPSGVYVVTIESPPYLACAVRRVQTPSPDLRTAFHSIIANWAPRHQIPSVLNLPPMRQVRDGMTINVTAEGVVDPGGKPRQTFMLFVTDYKEGQTEVRLVRQFPPK